MHFLFTLADVGVNLSLAPQVECDCAVDLFQGERREILLNRLRALAASKGVDDRVQRHPRARHVIAAIPLFDIVAAHPSADYTAKRPILHRGADGDGSSLNIRLARSFGTPFASEPPASRFEIGA